jgi:hypothetical protein
MGSFVNTAQSKKMKPITALISLGKERIIETVYWRDKKQHSGTD